MLMMEKGRKVVFSHFLLSQRESVQIGKYVLQESDTNVLSKSCKQRTVQVNLSGSADNTFTTDVALL